MTIEDAVNLLTKKYLDNQAKKWIHDPVAYTLYEVWKIADSREVYSPSYATVQPTTNAYRIRAMSDEELAEHLPWIFQRNICPKYDCSTEWVKEDCERHLLDWLKQEARDD